jgi:hypothetical protein
MTAFSSSSSDAATLSNLQGTYVKRRAVSRSSGWTRRSISSVNRFDSGDMLWRTRCHLAARQSTTISTPARTPTLRMERSQDSVPGHDGGPVTGGISEDSWRGADAARVTRPPNDDVTQIRALVEQSDTESVWVEPNLLPAGAVITAGSVLGHRYLLEYVLGEGGIGVVYRATDQEVTGETFAIKVLKPEIRSHAGALKLLREEVRKTRALRHPSIVGVYSLNSDPGGIYMLMEYLEGKSLNALLDEEFGRGMPPMRAWPLIHDVGSALAYAHDHNVIHSDLKPSNIFITTSGKAKLLDFGIARAVRGKTDRFDPGVLGALTPAYASLEMLQGNAPDQSDDVYSFACVIYETLSGRHPFDRMSALDARGANRNPPPIGSRPPCWCPRPFCVWP